MHAILLVGGRGSRLAPYTSLLPKALMSLGRYSILEVTLRRLRACGFVRVTLCISHLGDQIRTEFGDGRQLGLSIDYSVDPVPLGTAAPLLFVPEWTAPAVVMNGDLLTTVDFTELYRAHVKGDAMLTVAYQRRWLSANVGLLRTAGDRVVGIREKPKFQWDVVSGIYVADPLIRKYLPTDAVTDMPTLINSLVEHGEAVQGYLFTGAWHDIGTPARYERARARFLADQQFYLDPRQRRKSDTAEADLIDVELP